MKLAVLGSGNGGLATAYEWASRGHQVSLYGHEQHADNIIEVRERGGIEAEGVLSGFAPIVRSTTDISEATDGADALFVVGPAYATESLAAATRGHLRPGMAVDQERLAIADAIGVTVLSEPEMGVRQGYMTAANYTTGYSEAPGFIGIKAQDRLDQRYLTEDVGYSMVFWTDLARKLKVPTPTMDALIQIASRVLGRDLPKEGARTMATMGLSDLSTAELRAY